MTAAFVLLVLLLLALLTALWLLFELLDVRSDLRETRSDLVDARARIRRLDQANAQLRTDLNHICEHRACRIARRIGLT